MTTYSGPPAKEAELAEPMGNVRVVPQRRPPPRPPARLRNTLTTVGRILLLGVVGLLALVFLLLAGNPAVFLGVALLLLGLSPVLLVLTILGSHGLQHEGR